MKYKIITAVCCILGSLVFCSCIFGREIDRPPENTAPVEPVYADSLPLELTPPDTTLVVEPKETEAQLPEIPFTEEEIVMLAQTIYGEAQVLYWYGDNYGASYQARQAAVAWCALNRYDAAPRFGDTLSEILSKPAQFAWKAENPVTEEMLALACDVVYRWQLEKMGKTDVGRVLPSDYFFFEGDGKENHFRKEFEHTGETWDWSLPDPYKEVF